jgi:phosphoglycolate phosphatase-like HAD superfamily hydrolase
MPKHQSINPNTKEQGDEKPERSQVPALLFDLDGTLLDSAYEHWHQALEEEGVAIPSVRVHRSVGMSGRLMLRTLFTEIGLKGNSTKIEHLERLHKKNFEKRGRSGCIRAFRRTGRRLDEGCLEALRRST